TQAEHIPVHLGAMPEAVAAVIACGPDPDDVFVLNDPYAGGTHLPDVTLVSHTELGFAVTRAHHADVGGAEPGSLPAGSRTLDEEGVVIPPTRLDDATLDSLVARMRSPQERRGDLRAQLAANRLAARRVPGVGAPYGRFRGRLRARDRARARGLARERAGAGGRRGGERRDVVAHRGRPLPRLRPRPGAGDDEQRRDRQRSLHVLRDDRRRPGRVRGRGR